MTYAWPPDRSFWRDEFPARTTQMTTPFLFKGIIPDSAADPAAVLDGVAAIRRAHAAGDPTSAHARVYVGEDRRDDLLPQVMAAPPWPDNDFVAWMQDLAGAERFSLVVNNLETVSPTLAAGLGTFLASLVEGWGVPMGGAELVAFAGNYSATAFGVHQGYEDAFLTHLGPGTKHFYTWPNEQYEQLTGGTDPTYGDYQWLLKHGECFELEPGDALFLPRRVFHVGLQEEFSVSVAVPLYTYPDAAVLRRAVLPALIDAVLPEDVPGAGPGHALPSPMAVLELGAAPVAQRLTDLAAATLGSAVEQCGAAVEQHIRHRWSTLLSNGGWELVDLDLARSQAASAFDPEQVVPGATVSVTAPYQLVPAEGLVFLRGFQMKADASVLAPGLIAALNDGPLALPDDERLLDAVRALGATGGLTITARPAPEDTAS